MVSLHRLDHCLIDAELGENAAADFHVRTGYFMVDGLADVVEEGTCACDCDVGTELFGEHCGKMCDFD